ncbi:5-deoxyglucuronate isomerase [Actinacidiphila yanglinensis]|uniref:5-deoxyglucuronate isomerase n=1 Tax=Actinacidiphila yanglinensis TaxID=310779 RepID=A0A1H6C8J4_9ACTN|nr:5-deoxy-glucuronate isomerase [Actinacidiphila yanglinensis]SEG69271.1 5-deoxyglucuronate isomerase [Actinacidiphila yanglinensis]
MNGDGRWTLPLGSAAGDGWDVAVGPGREGWHHTSLRVAALSGADTRVLDGGDWEYLVVPLSGGVRVTARTPDGIAHEAELAGRADVFAGATDVAYVPARSRITLRSSSGAPARVALAGALVTGDGGPGGTGSGSAGGREFRHVTAGEVPVERRGAGTASREVRNFGTPDVLDADAIIACEVITPAGNWSSWPPHKHDTPRPGAETVLEEIYYFETRSTDPGGTDPVGYQRVYAASDDRPIDVLAEVRTGDVVLVPYGWHGPSIAAPDAHLYYLNVMAGPGPERAWLICDDPAHAGVRDTWPGRPFDGRLPLSGTASGDTA